MDKVGYTAGAFDLFHVGHLRHIKAASGLCDRLIVGVSSDELVEETKGKKPIVPFHERLEIVSSLECVDVAIGQYNLDKIVAWNKLKYDVLFIGDDWYCHDRFATYENWLKKFDVSVIYLPYTHHISTSLLKEKL